jgi:flavin-dependent dehydrogenase
VPRQRYDAVIVGARCAGATAAAVLARGGWDVLLLDRDEPGTGTLSTHGLWPNTLDRLDRLGALERLDARHELNPFELRFRVFDAEIIGGWTPIGGHTTGIAPRRVVLDATLVELATDAGAQTRLGERVVAVLGAGTPDDPVRGVRTARGEEIEARRTIGADGRASTIAGALALSKERELRGEMAMLFAYWRGLPRTGLMSMHAERHGVLTWGTCEDDVQLVILNGEPGIARGGDQARTATYLEGIRRFEATMDPRWLESAERTSAIYTAPETMMRGFYRRPAGPGWALAGDASHFKHPASAQGIADAIEHGARLGESLLGDDPDLGDYERWRDERGAEHYEWSFEFARFPSDAARIFWPAVAADPEAALDFRDTLSRHARPRSDFLTPERLKRWFAPAADREPG